MKNLVAFGDSCTFGHGLIDCHLPNGDPGPEPSKLAWPHQLAKKLQLKPSNLGIPGASNKEIANKILTTKLDTDCCVVICWSYIDRHSLIKKHSIEQVGPWKKDKISKSFYKHLYDRHDRMWEFYSKFNQITMFLDSKQIANYHFHVDQDELEPFKWNQFDMMPVDYANIRTKNPLAEDNLHPGPRAHKELADDIFKQIRTSSSSG